MPKDSVDLASTQVVIPSNGRRPNISITSYDKLQFAAKKIIEALGDNPNREGLIGTPKRFADAFVDDFSPDESPEKALGEMIMKEEFDQMIIVKKVPVRSFCEHHILPWFGQVSLGYIPSQMTVGLSKMTRMIDAAGKGLTIQERVTQHIADAMNEVLHPVGVMVVIDAVHTCTLMRGVRTELQRFITSAARGAFLTNPAPRNEFLTLIKD